MNNTQIEFLVTRLRGLEEKVRIFQGKLQDFASSAFVSDTHLFLSSILADISASIPILESLANQLHIPFDEIAFDRMIHADPADDSGKGSELEQIIADLEIEPSSEADVTSSTPPTELETEIISNSGSEHTDKSNEQA